jgi:fermentation-respiration switch protein FrsA (DUF1100 family)
MRKTIAQPASQAVPSRGKVPVGVVWFLGVALLLGSGCDRFSSEIIPDEAWNGHWSGTFRILGDSVHVILHLAEDDSEGLEARVSLPAQGVLGIPALVERDGDRLRFEVGPLASRYEGRLRGDPLTLRGDWFQAGGKFRLTLEPTTAPPALLRPQEPEPPFPYRIRNVWVEHSEGRVRLSGTLTLPEGEGPYPGAVLVSGSGPQDRDETLFGHRPFLVLADHLTRSGIAVLRYDDRGVGQSSGDFANATTEDFATDALAAVDSLAAQSEVDPERVGIIGHSEGGIVAPLAAVRSSRVAFVVSLAGTGVSGRELLELQTRRILEASGVPEPVIALNRRIQAEVLDNLLEAGDAEGALEVAGGKWEEAWGGLPHAALTALGLAAQVDRALEEQIRRVASPWMFFFLSFDPTTVFEEVEVPVLALCGSLDLQVPPDPNLRLIREALERSGNQDITTLELDGLNHLFQRATTGLPSEYGTLQETMAPEVLRLVAEWILSLDAGDSERRVP